MNFNILKEIKSDLLSKVDEQSKNSFQRFFKEEVKFYGVRSPNVHTVAVENFKKIKNFDKDEIFVLCEELLKTGYCEDAWIAAEWAYSQHEFFTEDDIDTFEASIEKYIDNWAECDTFCNHTIGSLIEKYPKLINRLYVWAKSHNRWMRRAAAVSLIIPAKNGKFLSNVFLISDILLLDRDDMVQKGYGWLLKEASRQHQQDVFDYVTVHKKVMPRTSLRYAIEKMPEELRKKALLK